MTYAQANNALESLDRLTAQSQFRRRLSGLDWASSTVGRWFDPSAGKLDYVAVSIVGDCVRCTDYEDGRRISSVDMPVAQWRKELAGMLMLGFVRA